MRADGSYVWVHALLRSRRDEQGRMVEVVGGVRDVSERKEQEARLREATERFERAFEQAPIGMALVGLDGAWMKVNQVLCQITGYSESELLAGFRRHHPPRGPRRRPEEFEDCSRRAQYIQGREALPARRRATHLVVMSASVVHDQRAHRSISSPRSRTSPSESTSRSASMHLAEHDPLTDLYNRRRFEAELERQVAALRVATGSTRR